MTTFSAGSVKSSIPLVLAVICLYCNSFGQTLSSPVPPVIPAPFGVTPTLDQQQALQNATPAQIQQIQSYLAPQMQQAIANHQPSGGNFRSWQDIISNGTSQMRQRSKRSAPRNITLLLLNRWCILAALPEVLSLLSA